MEKSTEMSALEAERNRLRKELLRMIVRNELQRRGETQALPKGYSPVSLQTAHS
ncbi:MAG: hypothetical protein Q4D62_12120 [Planctomycetia bacterium]|nr:hypothetical protein [Planctomycetia bacterium]